MPHALASPPCWQHRVHTHLWPAPGSLARTKSSYELTKCRTLLLPHLAGSTVYTIICGLLLVLWHYRTVYTSSQNAARSCFPTFLAAPRTHSSVACSVISGTNEMFIQAHKMPHALASPPCWQHRVHTVYGLLLVLWHYREVCRHHGVVPKAQHPLCTLAHEHLPKVSGCDLQRRKEVVCVCMCV